MKGAISVAQLQTTGNDHQKHSGQCAHHDIRQTGAGGDNQTGKDQKSRWGFAFVNNFVMHVFDNDQVGFSPQFFELAFRAPDQQDIADPQSDVLDVFFGIVQAAALNGNDMDVRIALQAALDQPLADQCRLRRYDKLDHKGCILTPR